MGWLFGKKKKAPMMPLPAGQAVDEKALKFPSASSSKKVIGAGDVKQAVGFNKPIDRFPQPKMEEELEKANEDLKSSFSSKPIDAPGMNRTSTAQNTAPAQTQVPASSSNTNFYEEDQRDRDGPLFVKVDVYQHILGGIEGLQKDARNLSSTSKKLDNSEFNEEAHFEKLKKELKVIHDKLLLADKTLFKS
jgi:hypothetical protein